MRHPFDGIIIPDSAEGVSPSGGLSGVQRAGAGPSRRSMLRWLLAAGAGLWAGLRARPVEAKGSSPDNPQEAAQHRLFLVAPKDVRRFSPQRRQQLGVAGDFVSGWQGQQELARTPGFLAWLTPPQAEALKSQTDVAGVHAISPAESDRGGPHAGPAALVVVLAPNAWHSKPKPGTFQSAEAIAQQWSTQFQGERVRVTRPRQDGRVVMTFGPGPIPEKVLAAIRQHPQAARLEWERMATTLALGEEGDRPPATTQAVGEEGGRPPVTTRALGEEGNPRPPMTTHAVGEEGGPRIPPGKVTTMALGEEGNPPPPPK